MSGSRFPPTELKLQNLRSQGIVPFSTDVQLLVLVLALGAVFSFLELPLEKLQELAKGCWGMEFSWDDPNFKWNLTVTALSFAISIALPLSIFLLLGGLLQTGWNLSLSLARRVYYPRQQPSLFSLAAASLKSLIFIIVAGILIKTEVLELIARFEPASSDLLDVDLIELLRDWWLAVLALFSLLAPGAWFICRQQFRQRHSMTREELEREIKESEVSAQTRGEMRRGILSE